MVRPIRILVWTITRWTVCLAVALLAIAPGHASGKPSLPPSNQATVSGGADAGLPRLLLALPGEAGGQRVKFEHLSIKEGLSQSSAHCILQDSLGLMWFGTWDGLNKYDGYDFTVYKHDPDDPYSLNNNVVQSLYEDRTGVLWIGTQAGLNELDRESGRFIRYQNDPNNPDSLSFGPVFDIFQDEQGTLWVGTDGGGLNAFMPESETFVHYRHNPADPNSLSDNRVLSIHEDDWGTLWIGTGGGGLNAFDRASQTFTHYRHDPNDPGSLGNNDVSVIYEDRQGIVWVGTNGGGLNRLERGGNAVRFTRYQHDPDDPNSLISDAVWALYEDRSGVLWVGSYDQGLDQFDRSTGRFVHHQHDPLDLTSLSRNNVLSIYEDGSGALWVGTNGGGLNKSDTGWRGFAHYRSNPNDPNSLSGNEVFPICEDYEGLVWIGTDGAGLNQFDRKTGRFIHYRHEPGQPGSLSSDRVMALYEDHSGRLWVGTLGGGLDKFERRNGTFTHYRNDPRDTRSLSTNSVTTIYQDRSEVLWVGTGGGLNKFDFDMEHFTRYQYDSNRSDSLSHNTVRAIHQDWQGYLWIGTDNGLNRFDAETEQFTRYYHNPDDPTSLSNNQILSILEDRFGVLWIATNGGGLNRFDRDKGTFSNYREKDGLPSDALIGILEETRLDTTAPAGMRSYLWLSTNNGLARFDPLTRTFKNYDVRDGLQSNEFNENAYHMGRNGEMFFGGVNGLSVFFPADIRDNPYVPPLVLTSLTQGGEVVDARPPENMKDVTLVWPSNFFEFEYAALSYIQSEKNNYAYWLENFERDWNYVGRRRFGKYTNLPGGVYTLRIKGANNDGVWNDPGIAIHITIMPPLWETWWFRGLLIMAVLGGAIGGYQWRVKSIEGQNLRLQNLVEQRTHEIERRRQELEALYRADAELYRHLRLDEVLQALVDIAVDILQIDKSSLIVWDERREKLVVRVARGFKPETLAHMAFTPGEGTVGRVAVTGQPMIVNDTRLDPRILNRDSVMAPEGILSFMQVPIKVGGEVFGVFSADFTHLRALGSDEQRLFIALAQRAALAIDSAQLYEQAQTLAVMEERNRLARDLHDAVTQTLFSASLIAEALPALWENDREEAHQLLRELRQLNRGALAEMRTLLMELRPTALIEANLGDLLRQLGEAVTGRKGVPVTVTVEGLCAFPPEVHVALYRIAQEALNNVVKHANASKIDVTLACDPSGRVELRICDDGRGFDPGCVPPDRLGLNIIRERAESVGARLDIESAPARGTCVAVTWEEPER